MNREIKFRGQNRLGRFVYGIPLLFDTNKSSEEVTLVSRYIAEDGAEHQEEWIVQKRTIGQYTGLKDKNGTEIYNGDILSENGNIIGVVVWSARYGVSIRKKNTTWALINFCPDSDFGCGTLSNIEVIGNIHDNPELLQ